MTEHTQEPQTPDTPQSIPQEPQDQNAPPSETLSRKPRSINNDNAVDRQRSTSTLDSLGGGNIL